MGDDPGGFGLEGPLLSKADTGENRGYDRVAGQSCRSDFLAECNGSKADGRGIHCDNRRDGGKHDRGKQHFDGRHTVLATDEFLDGALQIVRHCLLFPIFAARAFSY